MAHYRATIRYSGRYHVADVEADDLADALRRAADAVPEEARETAELAEVRRQVDPEAREYTPG